MLHKKEMTINANSPNKFSPTRRIEIYIVPLQTKYDISMEDYRPRVVDALLKRKLAGKGAVLIKGPKWCGKTTTAEQVARACCICLTQEAGNKISS